ncbi:Cytochrome c oxidase subunit IV isoform 1 [Cichlidogyrus casuarinus]|uniref:Cytochrome c oxidase subunit IV isoform 1 n=1 Tax=Cichlidogyrus casuarinus TaxID=1844966 RepID=A0ABD2Q105_9PLAT
MFKLASSCVLKKPVRRASSVLTQLEQQYFPHIGNREIVGYGRNGIPQYFDDLAWPYPSIRFRAHSDQIESLKKKEQGDWKSLSLEEKKTLYRHSFRQTFAEVKAPDPRYRRIYGLLLWGLSIPMGLFIYLKAFIDGGKDTILTLPEYKDAQISSQAHITRLLKEAFPKASEVVVEDISGGCGSMFKIHVENSEFASIPLLKQHQLIKVALKTEIKDLHGLTITTKS